jgi:hypothetical protein
MAKGDIMKDAEMDRILSNQDEIVPSSGFVALVMQAVRCETAAPPPIPFPWRRALPGLALAVFALVLVAVVGVSAIVKIGRTSFPQDLTVLSQQTLPPFVQEPIGSALGWTTSALLAALVSVKLSMRLAGGRR